MQIYQKSPTAEALPTIINHKGIRAVGARDLYHQLGLHSSQFARWAKKNITNNPFAQKDQDWFDGMSNGKLDYVLSLDFVKRLSIIVRAQRGESIRAYFVQSDNREQEGSRPRPSSMVNIDSRLVFATDANELQLLTYLASKMDKDRVCWPKNKTICAALKWGSIDRLQKTKKRLVAKGLLEVKGCVRENSPAQTSNDYKILTPLISNYVPTPTLKSGRGDTSKPLRSHTLKSGNQEVLTNEVLTNESNTPYNPPLGDGEKDLENVFAKAKNTNTGLGGEAAAGANESDEDELQERIYKFASDVQKAGGSNYTPRMLERFIKYWTEEEIPAGKRRRKLKFEDKKYFNIETRLEDWATNNVDKMQCYLSEEAVKSITEKKNVFKKLLEPFLPRYGKDMLNAFFQRWSQPENIPEPRRLAWECTKHWDLGNRLATWQSNSSQWGRSSGHITTTYEKRGSERT